MRRPLSELRGAVWVEKMTLLHYIPGKVLKRLVKRGLLVERLAGTREQGHYPACAGAILYRVGGAVAMWTDYPLAERPTRWYRPASCGPWPDRDVDFAAIDAAFRLGSAA